MADEHVEVGTAFLEPVQSGTAMRIASTFLLVFASLALVVGCRNVAGKRVSMQEWWHSRQDSTQKGDEPHDEPGDCPAAVEGTGESATAQATPADHTPDTSETTKPSAATDVSSPSPNAIHSDVLIVNDDTISVDDILEPLLPKIEQLAAELPPDAYYPRVRELVRQQIVEAVAQHLIWRKAQGTLSENIEPQIEKAVGKMEKDRINREFDGSETRYTKYLAKHGKTRDEIRLRLRRSLLIDGYLRDNLLPLVASPRKQELMQYYNAHNNRFSKPAQREMLLIDVPIAAFVDRRRPITQTNMDEAAGQARQTIQDAAEALKAGETFEDIVKKYSHGVNKHKGGTWGFISQPLQGRWAEPSKRLFELKPSETSEIIESAKSFFLVKCGKVEGGDVVSFQEAQPQITNTLRQQRFGKLRGEFLQKELDQSTIGSLDAFVTEVLKEIPPPKSQ